MANWKCPSCGGDCAEDALACSTCGQSATSDPLIGAEILRPLQEREREGFRSGLGFLIGAAIGFVAFVLFLVFGDPMPTRSQGAYLIAFVFGGCMFGLTVGSAGPILYRWWHARNRRRSRP